MSIIYVQILLIELFLDLLSVHKSRRALFACMLSFQIHLFDILSVIFSYQTSRPYDAAGRTKTDVTPAILSHDFVAQLIRACDMPCRIMQLYRINKN